MEVSHQVFHLPYLSLLVLRYLLLAVHLCLLVLQHLHLGVRQHHPVLVPVQQPTILGPTIGMSLLVALVRLLVHPRQYLHQLARVKVHPYRQVYHHLSHPQLAQVLAPHSRRAPVYLLQNRPAPVRPCHPALVRLYRRVQALQRRLLVQYLHQ